MPLSFDRRGLALAMAAILSASTSALAMGDPADSCQAAKLREFGKLASCQFGNLAKAVKSNSVLDVAKGEVCDDNFASKLAMAEDKAGGACRTTGDSAQFATLIDSLVSMVDDRLSGVRFHDNGDGTVSDAAQQVIWQKQTAGTGSSSSVDEVRAIPDVLAWLGSLNGDATEPGLGGQSDWGLPTLAQVQSILDCTTLPCRFVDPVLGPEPTPSSGGSTYILTGETSTLPLSTIPCFKRVRLEDGSVSCADGPSANGSSRARIMNNAR